MINCENYYPKIDLEQIKSHVIKACNKHPAFCDSIDVRRRAAINQALANHRWRADNIGSAQSILAEEIEEMFQAYANGDNEKAIDECYDAIAVLIRIINRLKQQIKISNKKWGGVAKINRCKIQNTTTNHTKTLHRPFLPGGQMTTQEKNAEIDEALAHLYEERIMEKKLKEKKK